MIVNNEPGGATFAMPGVRDHEEEDEEGASAGGVNIPVAMVRERELESERRTKGRGGTNVLYMYAYPLFGGTVSVALNSLLHMYAMISRFLIEASTIC